MANPVNTIGIIMPSDFDHFSYDAVWDHIRSKSQQLTPPRIQLASAWNGIGFRFRACTDHSNAFTEAITSKQDAENRYIQERELFAFFANGLATLECFYFAMFAVGAMLHPSDFPFKNSDDMQKVTPRETTKRYKNAFLNDKITSTMESIVGLKRGLGCVEFEEWSEIRNILTHRESTSRIHFLNVNSGIQSRPPEWNLTPSFTFDQNTTLLRHIWLAETLNNLLIETKKFVEVHFI